MSGEKMKKSGRKNEKHQVHSVGEMFSLNHGARVRSVSMRILIEYQFHATATDDMNVKLFDPDAGGRIFSVYISLDPKHSIYRKEFSCDG